MKFHWFAEMTYPGLPPDFRDRHDGAWVDLPRRLYDPARGAELYDDFLACYRHADAVGFDGISVNEHHQYAGAVCPSPNLFAAVLARTTERADLLLLGNSIALYNPPVRVAEEIAMLDVLSRGRVIAGFVLGTPMDAAFSYGTSPAELRERFREAHDLILAAWTAEEPFPFAGRFTQLPAVNVWPRTLQMPHPPIWVPGFGSVETWELTAANDYCYSHLSFSGLDKARSVVGDYWRFVDERGADANPHRFGFAQVIFVADSEAEAERRYGAAAELFFNQMAYAPGRFLRAPGYRSPRSQAAPRGGRKPPSSPGPVRFREAVRRGSVVAGSPETVRDRLGELAEELRVGQLICLLHLGDLDREATLENTGRFAAEVAPALRPLHAELPDRWTARGRAEQLASRTEPTHPHAVPRQRPRVEASRRDEVGGRHAS